MVCVVSNCCPAKSIVGQRVLALTISDVLAVCFGASIDNVVECMVSQLVTNIPNTTKVLVSAILFFR